MPVTVKRAILWRTETRNAPGMLARTLFPLAHTRQDLQIVIGYAYPDKAMAAIEVYPIESRAAAAAASQAGLEQSNFPCLIVTGDNLPGLSYRITRGLSESGVNLNFFIAQVIGKKYTALFGFEAQSEADLAAQVIRKATRSVAAVAAPRKAGSTATRPRRKALRSAR
ncbi:MAG: hypothetical protein U1A27_06215 [Phycisphaerae bacterium]